jgi:hypothetical protein
MKKIIIFFSLIILISCKKSEDFNGKACFTISTSQTIHVGESVTFTNCSENSVYYLWDFDDRTTSTEMNPSHTFTKAGERRVVLVVQDSKFKDVNADGMIDEMDKIGSYDTAEITLTVLDVE